MLFFFSREKKKTKLNTFTSHFSPNSLAYFKAKPWKELPTLRLQFLSSQTLIKPVSGHGQPQ